MVQADRKFSKGADCWYFDVNVGTSSLRNYLQNGALDDLDLMTLGLAMSKRRGQYNDRCFRWLIGGFRPFSDSSF